MISVLTSFLSLQETYQDLADNSGQFVVEYRRECVLRPVVVAVLQEKKSPETCDTSASFITAHPKSSRYCCLFVKKCTLLFTHMYNPILLTVLIIIIHILIQAGQQAWR